MNPFEKNLSALRKNRPDLATIVDSLPENDRYRLIETPSGFPSLEVIDGSGKPMLWHSRYDPIREAERDLSTLDRFGIYVPLVAGMGLGYSLRLLYDRCRDEFFDLAVLESDPHIFRLALRTTRLDDILSDPRTYFHIGPGLTAWSELIKTLLPSIMSSTLQIIHHRVSQRYEPLFYESAFNTVSQRIQLTRAEFDLMIRSGPRIQENIWLNLPSITRSTGLNQVRQTLRGKPAIVIAAGPSLDKNVSLLRGVRDSFALIAVDTAYHTLKNHGVEPHIVVTTDPTDLNLKHFENIQPAPDTILAFDPEVYFAIPNQWPSGFLYLNLEKTAMTRWLEKVCGPFGYLPKGGSVGHTAFYLARELGADPIVFIGLDLAFDPQGGATHTAGSSLHRKHGQIASGVDTATLGPRFQADAMQEKIVWVPGADGQPVPTSRIMALYIQQFNEEIANTNAKVIDATEGGALLQETEIVPLAQVIAHYSANTNDLEQIFEKYKAPPGNPDRLNEELERILSSLQNAKHDAFRGEDITARLSPRLREGASLRETSDWIDMETCFSKIYEPEPIKIAMEQALFQAIYYFIQKERLSQIEQRLSKYQNFFKTFITLQPHFEQLIRKIKNNFEV